MDAQSITLWIRQNPDVITRVLILLGVGLLLMHLLPLFLKRVLRKHCSEQTLVLISKAMVGTLLALVAVMILREMGFKLTALMGAAGIEGVAVGFAYQSSLANIISGVFLISEKPFQIGDLIKANGEEGLVHSIDLISIKLRTFDNRLIRIPYENLLKNPVTNVTRFPIRRLNVQIGVAYKEDIRRVMEILAQLAQDNPYCLDEPAPLIMFKGFGSSSIDFFLGLWCVKDDIIDLRNTVMVEIKERFEREGIEIPFPHLSIYAGSRSQPFTVRPGKETVPPVPERPDPGAGI